VPKQARTTRRRRGHALIVSGYGVRIHVRHGQLVVEDGIAETRRETAYPRVGQNISRLVVVAQDGSVSLAAIRWLANLDIPYLHLDRDGRLIAGTISAGLDDARLRRTQALAATSSTGLEISRTLIATKIRGQQSNLSELGADLAPLDNALELTLSAKSLDDVRGAESTAALAYWSAWSGLRLEFHGRDEQRVPAHWRRFDRRGSEITGNPRLATDPTNAILNYLYALLETETTVACRAIGLDAGMGIIHADAPARSSLALDVMEAGRPAVDWYVLGLLRDRVFSVRDFMETSKGVCRVMPPLRDVLAATVTTWAGHIAPHVEHVARKLAHAGGVPAPPTLLTGQRRRAARPASARTRAPMPTKPARPPRRCVECGIEIGSSRRRCDACHQADNAARLIDQQRAETRRRQETGDHPSKRSGVRARIGATQRAQWQRRAPTDDSDGFGYGTSGFVRMVLPRIADLSTDELAKATGLSRGYCASIRDGKRVPHRRHWGALHLAGLQHGDERRSQAASGAASQ
jgi:CRISPR-associated endonuclease Cas1